MEETRRKFLKESLLGITSLCFIKNNIFNEKAYAEESKGTPSQKEEFPLYEAKFYKKLDNKKIKCELCPHECEVANLERGSCEVRENRDGTYYTLVHSRVCALHIDPIEKKPLFHYLPGTTALSLATAGCNIECKFCQNWDISQSRPEQVKSTFMPPDTIVNLAKEKKSPTIAYTYSEPIVFYEYMYDTATAAKKNGIGNVMISNGFIEPKPLKELCNVLSAIKIDFKSFSDEFYTKICSGRLRPVLNTLENLSKIGIWYEIVVLVIPTLNDDEKDVKNMCGWIAKNLGKNVPLHFTRFRPMYKLKNLPDTPIKTLERCRNIALSEGLRFVYTGNLPGHEGENTYCPKCSKVVIKRIGYSIEENNISNGNCKFCNENIPGIWNV